MQTLSPQVMSVDSQARPRAAETDLKVTLQDELTLADQESWQRLVGDDPHPSIQAFPEVARLRSDASLLRLTDCDDNWRALAILLPETLDVRHHLLPGTTGPLPGFHLAGNRLLSVDHERDTAPLVTAIAQELVAADRKLLEIEDVALDSVFWQELRKLTRHGFRIGTPLEPQPHYRLRLPDTADEYWSRFSSKTRSQMRRRRRKLNATLKRFTDPADVDVFLDKGHAVSLKTWQWQQRQLCLSNDEQSRQKHRQLAEMGLWRAYLLCADDEPVAYVDGHQSGGTYYYEQPGYDQSWTKFGPGRVLITCLIDDLYDHDRPRICDFGPGFMPYKEEFSNEHTMNSTVWVLPPGASSWRISQSLKWKQRGHKAVKTVLTKSGMWLRVRAFSHRFRAAAPAVD